MNLKISVIIPCYNGFRYMKRCLESFEKQTVKPYEIIIADDCSTDDSFERLKEYAENSKLNFVIIRNEKNMGPGIARKNAVDVSGGDYIAFCDCDDWFETDFIQIITENINKHNADVLMFDSYYTYDDRKIVSNPVKKLSSGNKNEILANIDMSLCKTVVKKQILTGIEFPALYHGEDGAVVPQIIANSESFILIDKPLYNYYYRTGSASQKLSDKAAFDMVEAFKTVQRNLPRKYFAECEFIGIKYVCYGAVLSGFKSGIKTKDIKNILNDFEKDFPDWINNKYIRNLGKIKNIYLILLKKRMFIPVKLMTSLHGFYIQTRRK